MSDHTEQENVSGAEASANGVNEDAESFKKMFEASLREQAVIKRGETVRGVVVSRDTESVIVDVGAKAEGAIPVSEFAQANLDLPDAGDEVEAMVQSVGGAAGVKLSVLEACRRNIWNAVDEASQTGNTLEATVTAEVKGGFRVDLGGLNAFMPKSEADPDPHMPADNIIGKACQVVVLEARRKPENIVVSRKQPLASEQQQQREAFFNSVSVGDRVSGEVKRLANFGAFVDLGGVDALLHVSDIAWRRLNHPSEMLSVGQSVKAEIIKLDKEKGKVSLSMKVLQADPWDKASETYEPGMRLTGTVRRLLDFGAVVELEPGIEGMIHRSEMSWTRKDVKPTQLLAEGDVVDVAVLEVEPEARRIRLSLKAVMENPWHVWLSHHPVGSRVSGKVKNLTDFGFFVAVDDDLDGLVHIENLSWDKAGAEALGEYKKGQQVECAVLGVDVERQRIALGIKQLSDDPFELFLAGIKRGGSVSGKVVEVSKGAFIVELTDGIRAWLPLREVPRDHGEIKVGSEVDAKVVDVNKKRRQVELSIKKMLHDEERDAVRNYAQQVKQKDTPSALALELQRKLLDKQQGPKKAKS
ncbi:MAG: 30S ribosomal protein S1 [Mariprofundaceae bacterium]